MVKRKFTLTAISERQLRCKMLFRVHQMFGGFIVSLWMTRVHIEILFSTKTQDPKQTERFEQHVCAPTIVMVNKCGPNITTDLHNNNTVCFQCKANKEMQEIGT